ncbi:MAG: nucleotide exchange factor GrpE [Candidatus Sungbacteria bacterium]|nr:nucleotide exchange factor GrpE [Candidatus Sungbacteria bacterium]
MAEEKTEIVPDEEFSAQDSTEKIKKLKEELKKCDVDKKEYLDGWQRSRAEHINYKKDEGKRFEDMARFIVSGLIGDVLPILDSFDLASQSGRQRPSGDRQKFEEQGILLIRSQLEDILKKRGLSEIAVKADDEFDPSKHESVGEVESEQVEGRIAEIVQRGYAFREKVLRPARVRLSKGRTS